LDSAKSVLENLHGKFLDWTLRPGAEIKSFPLEVELTKIGDIFTKRGYGKKKPFINAELYCHKALSIPMLVVGSHYTNKYRFTPND
jgi:hypothetical protein